MSVPTIIYTHTDEAPALATASFLPVIQAFLEGTGIQIETRDISLASRILANFSDALTSEQWVDDALAELAQLTGKLRFAAEGGDERQMEEAEHEVRALSKHLPDHYKVEALARAAKTPTPGGGELAGLYLDRCFKLADEDYLRLKEIEERIAALETTESAEQG